LGRRWVGQEGFTLIEIMFVVAAAVTITAVAAPRIDAYLRIQRASNGARLVERQLQSARLKAVSASRSLRLRFDCPSTGKLRILELTGVATTDNATNRCDPVTYPSPDLQTRFGSTPSSIHPSLIFRRGRRSPVRRFRSNSHRKGRRLSSRGGACALADNTVITVTAPVFQERWRLTALAASNSTKDAGFVIEVMIA
jgi:type II secretory pathway pseudopilin PulG